MANYRKQEIYMLNEAEKSVIDNITRDFFLSAAGEVYAK